MFRTTYLLPLLASATLLVACGHGKGNGSMSAPPATPTRGQLLNNPPPPLATYSTSDLLSNVFPDVLGDRLSVAV
jgi:hypothetical protein